MDLKAVGQRIKAAREAKNLTQEELAALVNLSPTHVRFSSLFIEKLPTTSGSPSLYFNKLFPIIIPKNDKREAAEKPLPHFSIMTLNLVLPLTHTSILRCLILPGF